MCCVSICFGQTETHFVLSAPEGKARARRRRDSKRNSPELFFSFWKQLQISSDVSSKTKASKVPVLSQNAAVFLQVALAANAHAAHDVAEAQQWSVAKAWLVYVHIFSLDLCCWICLSTCFPNDWMIMMILDVELFWNPFDMFEKVITVITHNCSFLAGRKRVGARRQCQDVPSFVTQTKSWCRSWRRWQNASVLSTFHTFPHLSTPLLNGWSMLILWSEHFA